jgi:hypothetical protein
MRFVALDLGPKKICSCFGDRLCPGRQSRGSPLCQQLRRAPAFFVTRGGWEVAAGGEVSKVAVQNARARAAALQAERISVAEARKVAKLPTLTEGIAPGTFDRWLELLDELEANLAASRAPL